jgi:hypothetical protein
MSQMNRSTLLLLVVKEEPLQRAGGGIRDVGDMRTLNPIQGFTNV